MKIFMTGVLAALFPMAAHAGTDIVRPGTVDDTLAITRVGEDLSLSWSPSCSPHASGYLVYEGTLDGSYDHVPMNCGDPVGGNSVSVSPGPGSRYYLVVAEDDAEEGSHGKTSLGDERPSGPSPCRGVQQTGACLLGPDLAATTINGTAAYGAVGGVHAYSFGYHACNFGDVSLAWSALGPNHPVVTTNLYRLDGGGFRQIGMSWAHHTSSALAQNLCGTCTDPGAFDQLGAGCSTTSSAFAVGGQPTLGPRSEIDPTTGAFPFPHTGGGSGPPTFKRLQVASADLDPSANPGAAYFVEMQFVSAEDAFWGNTRDNVTHRPVTVSGAPGSYTLGFAGAELAGPALGSWSGAALDEVEIEEDGRLYVGSATTDLGDGTWLYEYAVYNQDSRRAVGEVSIPLACATGVSGTEFHDVAYHSGEPYDGTDWAVTVVPDAVRWETVAYEIDPDANALRWGTLYSFRFVADRPPGAGEVEIGLFLPGTPEAVTAAARVPTASCK